MAREIRICPVCSTKFSASMDGAFCPACMLRKALSGAESGEPGYEDAADPLPDHVAQRFENFELVTDDGGRPLELGRGAMGVTYKAFDVDLQYPVTLKVIGERYLGDESARLRFLREARAAASVRHPNVASVFHLGRTGENYFYAMEFVEGETLESLIKRSGCLDVKLALEIVTQVAGGLAAVDRQKLVHRDIKPSNIMARLEDGGSVTAKIIDLGLAKAVNEPGSSISMAGGFAGTPEFASPEQFAGVGVDIRSDLYSLGVTLWAMVTGRGLFRGTPAEVMYQHLHTPLPLEQLKGVPQPVVILIKVLLEKDPLRRFQTPTELLKAMPAIAEAIDRASPNQDLGQIPTRTFYALTGKPPAKLGPDKISVAGMPVTGSDILGREDDMTFLDAAWANSDTNLVTIVAWAGVGKSALVNRWLERMAADYYRSAELVFAWSFNGQDGGETSSAEQFLDVALTWFGDPDPRNGTARERGEKLANLIAHRRTLLVLDGFDALQYPLGLQRGQVCQPALKALLRDLAAFNTGLCVVTTRLPVVDIADSELGGAITLPLHELAVQRISRNRVAQVSRSP
jgi:Protein kinase domain/NACHT domain